MENSIIKNEFLVDSYKFQTQSKILLIQDDEKDPKLVNIITENTIFHPQGGGQPSDIGEFIFKGKIIKIHSLGFIRESETVLHKILQEDKQDMNIGDEIIQKIDENFRKLNARLHSAGHLMDTCVQNLNLDWVPGKGYHFEAGSYVEYIGTIDPKQTEQIRQQLNEQCGKLIQESSEQDQMEAVVYSYDEAQKIFEVPSYIPVGSPIRYVKLMKADKGCPCGGTHVKNIKDIQGINITKINKKGKNIRVSYSVK